MENREDEVVLGLLPLSFDYGLYQLLMTFRFGGRLILERSFAYPALILQRIQEEKVTGFPGVPTIFAMLLQMDRSQFELSSLRYLTNTAAALAPSHVQELQDAGAEHLFASPAELDEWFKATLPGLEIHDPFSLSE